MVGFILPNGITGGAIFSEDRAYRQLLTRQRKETYKKIILWVGLNPSTAGGDEDDRTTQIETNISWRANFFFYAKVNVCDLVATRPQNMLRSEAPRSDANIKMIRRWANNPKTTTIVLAFGIFQPEIRLYMRETVELLKQTGHPLLCIGANKDGSPKHPLYAPRDAELVPWQEVLI